MRSQGIMNRKHVIWAVMLALALALFCGTCAMAAGDPLNVSMALSSYTFSEPQEIKVSISVTNAGESDLPGPATLYFPNGKQVEEFGAPMLTVGTSKSITVSWKVTQQQLETGLVTFKLRYSLYNDEGELVNKTKNFSKRITYTGAAPELTINRVIRPTTARKGQEVTVTYEVENTGTSDVSDITIKENSAVSKTSGKIANLPAGEKSSYVFSFTMGSKDVTSSATVTYKAGKKSYTQKVEAAAIKYGEVKLSAALSADKKGGAPGDTLKLTIVLKNSGNLDFTKVTLSDEKLGTLFSDLTVKAGESVSLEKEITITETRDIQLTVAGEDSAGNPVETATGKVNVIATDPTQQIVLSVEASADRMIVYELPGTVRFTITVRNESAVEVKNIRVLAVDTEINSFDAIPAGESRTFTREMAVSMAGTFQFTASCRDQLNQRLTFNSGTIQIVKDNPTPVPTEAPIVTPPAPREKKVPQSYEEVDEKLKLPAWTEQAEGIADIARWVFGGIAALLLLLLLIGAIRRSARKSREKDTFGQLSDSTYRDYSAEPRRKHRSVITDNGKDDAPAPSEQPQETENTAQDSELMAETLQRLYQQPDQAAEQPAETPEAESGSGEKEVSAAEAAHRRRRQD